jgi:hypothetical protein
MMKNCLGEEMENGIEMSRMANGSTNDFDLGNDRDVYELVSVRANDL